MMEMDEVRAPRRKFSRLTRDESFGTEEDEAQLRVGQEEESSPIITMMEYHHHQPTAATTYDPASSFLRLSRASPNMVQHHHHHHYVPTSLYESHPWTRSRSVSSLSDASCSSDVLETTKSAKSSPIGSDCSIGNYDYSRPDSGACSAATRIEMDAVDRYEAWSRSSCPSSEELSEVFMWVDEDSDGLISGADLQSFLSRVLEFDISENEAETLLVLYGNGRTLRTGTGVVVNFEGFLTLYQCLCAEQPSPEEQSMMAAASQVFDGTRLKSDRWA